MFVFSSVLSAPNGQTRAFSVLEHLQEILVVPAYNLTAQKSWQLVE